MKQLDVDVSPPAFVWKPLLIVARPLTLNHATFDLDPGDFYLQLIMQNP